MERITIGYSPAFGIPHVSGGPIAYHKLITYYANDGSVKVIEFGPTHTVTDTLTKVTLATNEELYSTDPHDSKFGPIKVYDREGNQTDVERPQQTILEENDLSSQFDLLRENAHDIANESYEYRPLTQNSNTAADEALLRTGFGPYDPVDDDGNVYPSPGSNLPDNNRPQDPGMPPETPTEIGGSGDPDPDDPFDPSNAPDWDPFADPFTDPPISPLVFDLDGDGLDIVHLNNSNAFFDLNQNGFAEHTAWIGSDDGFLVYDVNLNGVIDDISEMFGSQDVDGFTILSAFDSNDDRVINDSDSIFNSLRIWKDLNGNGITNSGEMFNLSDFGVSEISLSSQLLDQWDQGNWVSHVSSFSTGGPEAGKIYDIWFENDQMKSVYLNQDNATVSENILALPNLAGYGSAASLRVSMAEDAGLAAMIHDLAAGSAEMTIAELRAGF